tara:strand:- start:4963 stop:5823 length:861 start_codon:yes stop_codon:yes gene_type:complete
MKKINDIKNPYYGAYYNIRNSKCLRYPNNGNVGECNIADSGIYNNGKICKFIPSLWGFKETNICLPINCKGEYNPNKMCKEKYINTRKPQNIKCNEKNTLTYSLEEDEWGNEKYRKQYYINGKVINDDTTEKGTWKCMCKAGYYGDICDLKKKKLEEDCSNDIQCNSNNCVKKFESDAIKSAINNMRLALDNEKPFFGLCKKGSFEIQKEKKDKIMKENANKTSFLNAMTGLVFFVFALLIIGYFFYNIKSLFNSISGEIKSGYNYTIKKTNNLVKKVKNYRNKKK